MFIIKLLYAIMEILDKARLQSCFYYENELPPTVEIRELEQGYEEEIIVRKNGISFMMKGEVRFTFRDYPEKTHHRGEFIFIPVGGMFRYRVIKKALIVIVRLNERVNLCEGCHIEELFKQGGAQSERSSREVNALKMNLPLWHFLIGLNRAVRGGLNCRYYFDTKARELFILLKAYYSQEVLRDFFSLILSPDTEFSEHVRANHHKYKTAKELAEAMNLEPKLFSKKFMKIFGEPPINWMEKEKAYRIYAELNFGRKPIAQIADEFRFSSQSHLNKFCKRVFSKNPREIRNSG